MTLAALVKVFAVKKNSNVFVRKDFGAKVVKIHCAPHPVKMVNVAS
jgi:hypothetical protein